MSVLARRYDSVSRARSASSTLLLTFLEPPSASLPRRHMSSSQATSVEAFNTWSRAVIGAASVKWAVRITEPYIGVEEVEAVKRVLLSGWLAHGPLVERFEEEFARVAAARHAVAVSSGTAALELMLRAAGVGPGDEVIVPAFTFIATANAVLAVGARPVFADIELDYYTVDPDSVAENITGRTKAIIAVHLYGHPADMRALRDLAEDHRLLLFEDAAQAHGASTPEGPVGGLGDAAAFSFYATKNMTTGEGGMVTTNDDELARRVRLLRDHCQERKYLHVCLGFNYRMTSMQAALGLVQLRRLRALNEARRRNASLLTRMLAGTGLILPRERPGYTHVYHQYVVRVDPGRVGVTRDELAARLASRGIQTAIHYPRPIPDQPLYRSLGYPPSSRIAPRALLASRQVLSLPVHPKLRRRDVELVAEEVRKALEGGV